MGTGPSADTGPDIDLQPSAGTVLIIKQSISEVRRTPLLFGLFVVVAVLGLLYQPLNNLLSLLAGALGVMMVYSEMGGRVESDTSVGVRLIVAFIAGLISGIAIVIGLVLLIVPGVYLAVRLRLVTATVMVENCGPLEAQSRSFELTESHGWTILGVSITISVISLVIGGIVAILVTGGPSVSGSVKSIRRLIELSGGISTIITGPVSAAANAVMFTLYTSGE